MPAFLRPAPLGAFVLAASAAVAQTGHPPGGTEEAVVPWLKGSATVGCPIFRDGFDPVAVWLFRNGFEAEGHLWPSMIGAPIVYVTTGGYTIHVDRHTITVTDPLGLNKVEHWGDPHENLNGKHIKDWGGAPGWSEHRRSLLLADGTKVTMSAPGWNGVVLHTSIYDGRQNVQIDNCANMIVHYSASTADTQARDQAQYDGETSRFETSMATAVATYTNIYNEDADFQVAPFNTPLGDTGGYANPGQVRDFFDDPRLGHT